MQGVRSYTDADADGCCRVVNAAIQDMDGLNNAARAFIRAKNTPAQFDAELRHWFTLIFEADDGRILGVGALDGEEIKRVYVDLLAQGHGVGRALMQALEVEALQRGLRKVAIEASPSAVPFYEQLGYVRLKEDGFTRGEAVFRYVRMWKALRSPER